MDKFAYSKIMDITPRKRAQVMALRQHTGMSIRKIENELNLSKSRVGGILKMRKIVVTSPPSIDGVDVEEKEKLRLMMIT